MTTDDEVAALLAFDEGAPDVDRAWRALQARTSAPQPRRGRRWIAAALVLAAAAMLAVVWTRGPSASAGEVEARARQTVAIGHRGVAVVEAGTVLRWSVDEDGAARVQQSAGAVFYRVNAGDEFVVETPAGRATVTGTCFTLELEPMRNEIKLAASALAGAAAAATVVLTVQEGEVVLANDTGRVQVGAGEAAHARVGSAPELGDLGEHEAPASAHESLYASLVRENTEQRRALRRLQEELAAARGDGPATSDAQEPDDQSGADQSKEDRRTLARHCAVNGDCDEKLWTDPSVDELRELARCGRILVDTPSFLQGDDFFPPGYVIESAGLSEDEAARYAEIAEALYKESGTKYAEFAHELGVPTELVDRLAPEQLGMLVDAVVDDWDDTRHRVANERAQLSSPPAEQTPSERALRYQWGLGEEFERRLAAAFGPDAAREMRRAGGGWSTKNTWSGRECLD